MRIYGWSKSLTVKPVDFVCCKELSGFLHREAEELPKGTRVREDWSFLIGDSS